MNIPVRHKHTHTKKKRLPAPARTFPMMKRNKNASIQSHVALMWNPAVIFIVTSRSDQYLFGRLLWVQLLT